MLEDFGRKKHSYLYFVILGILVLAVFIITTSAMIVPKVFGLLPMPLLALVISISFFNSETVGFTIGLLAGALLDLISDKFPGFNCLIFIAIGLGCALLAEHFINRRLFPCLIASLVLCTSYYTVYWLAFEADQGFYYFFRVTVWQSVYTWLFTIPFYYFFKYWSKKLLK